MDYVCVDRGSDRCPCILMEAGQCYNCGMIQRGKCDCNSLWQGVCPYTEYLQRNKKIIPEMKVRNYKVSYIKSYTPTLSVLTLETPLGFALKCKEMGAFLMVGWKEWFIPLSVLNTYEDFGSQLGYVDIGINATGPKTIGLLKKAIIGENVPIKGPFYSGLMNKGQFKRTADSIVVARGVALMPLINIKDMLAKNLVNIKVDPGKLGEEFLHCYFNDIPYETIDLEKDIFEIAEDTKETFGYSYKEGQKPNLFLMTSPYYVERFLKLTGFSKKNIIAPNHSNMCCGEGYCGSCSSTDLEGVTVRKCKCIDE